MSNPIGNQKQKLNKEATELATALNKNDHTLMAMTSGDILAWSIC